MHTGKDTNHSVPLDDTGHMEYPQVTSIQIKTQNIISTEERLRKGRLLKDSYFLYPLNSPDLR